MQVEQIWPVRWSQKQRLEFIEFRLLWEGRVNRSDLLQFFGISVPQASLDFAKYREIAPDNAVYNGTEKAYIAGPEFKPVLVSGSPDEYLNRLFAVECGHLESNSTFLGWRPPTGIAQSTNRTLNAGNLRHILQAIHEHRAAAINYQSMNVSLPGYRKITPHALGFDGFRWHVRAFCHKHSDFRDFVMARILAIQIDERSQINHEEDQEWHRYVEVILVPGSGLSASQRKITELDYGMLDGRLVLRVREALLFYYLNHLGLLYGPDAPAPPSHIDLANRKDLEPFFKRHAIASH